ncbi:MAG: sigma-70 family RNA polymerase sigma factor [Treponema sp.]|nr:sigma-70 family RNA polymerase sigma factor [Candidatus Treponema equi]
MNEFNPFENYLRSLDRYAFIAADEEREMIIRAQSGSKKDSDRLVQSNLRFVIDQAKKMKRYNVDFEDLVSAGNLGLVKAVQRFDLSRKVRFITYAAFWVYAEMMEEIYGSSMIRLPHNCNVAMAKIKSIDSKLPKGMGDEERCAYIAQRLKMKESSIKALLYCARDVASLDAQIAEDDECNLYGVIGDSVYDPVEEMERKDVIDHVSRFMGCLSDEERKVIEKHYGFNGVIPMTYSEIARSWKGGISREGIRQKELKAMKRMQEKMHAECFETYLDVAV